MKNTLAVAMLLAGGLLVYSGFKNWTVAETLRFFTGQGAPDEFDGTTMTPEDYEKLGKYSVPDPSAPGPTPGTIENGGALPGIGAPPPTAAGGPQLFGIG